MNALNFVFWLQGRLEIGQTQDGLTFEEVQIIKDHIKLVLSKETPERTPFDYNRQICVGGSDVEYRDGLDPNIQEIINKSLEKFNPKVVYKPVAGSC